MTHFSLKWLLLRQVQQVWQQGRTLQQVWQTAAVPQPACAVALGWRTLRRQELTAPKRQQSSFSSPVQTLGYRSALCQGLGGRLPAGPAAADLAIAMVADWPPQAVEAGALPWRCRQNSDWLGYDLAIADLGPWLIGLADPLPPRQANAVPLAWPTADQLFQLQATHARCCSLLAQVADQPALQMVPWAALDTPAYGWLQGAIATTDAWQADQLGLAQLPLWQPLTQLAAGFEQIHQQTPLWAELAPARRQVYLGLVIITQRLLSQLLPLGWGIPAWKTL